MTESENRVRKQNRHICELFDDNTELRQRIAELESRTVTVKLPPAVSVADWMVDIDVYEADLLRALLTAAGIKVEAE
ncbi:TPA: ead/Ea22-like family protein, partial [Klebsiella pneumoniae]|nr:ead/Ea22-like family protein [Klebsiella pneumoniae]